MYAEVDGKGHHLQLLAYIQDHWKYGTDISKEEGKTRSANGTERDKIISIVWEVMVLWKYGSTDWIQLKYIKDSNPV